MNHKPSKIFPIRNTNLQLSRRKLASPVLVGMMVILFALTSAHAWWDKQWTSRKQFTLDTTSEGGKITEPIGTAIVLLRLHQGNFQFEAAKDNGSDIRIVAEDDKTLLPYHIEKYDALLNEAFVWVKIPDLKPNAKTKLWIYYGNPNDKGENGADSKATYGDQDVLVYHFGQGSAAPTDFTKEKNNAETPGTPAEGSMIGPGLRLLGATPIRIPASDSLDWSKATGLTWSAWIKAAALQPNAIIFSREQDDKALRIGVDNGVPYVEVKDASGTKRSPAGAPITAGAWKHLAVTEEGSKFTLFVDGEPYGELSAALPPLTSPLLLGGNGTEGSGFVGELDELQIAQKAHTPGAIKLAAVGQSGSDRATKMMVFAQDEGGQSGGIGEHLSIFVDISKSLTFDGWAVIFLCTVLAGVGWFVAIRKFLYLNRIKKGNDEFLKQWRNVANDLTQLDHTDKDNIKSMGGTAEEDSMEMIQQSPIYHVYHIGSEEIRHRMENNQKGFSGLSARSIQAIRASLDGGLSREAQSLNGDLVFLTISIAGGPYLGLLGTVIGVMITFATIAKTGQVEVNSIAPGIAGALLATVAGLLVAIPALFIYSYLNARIKEAINAMQTFINEFISKVAEFYPSTSE